MTDDEVLALVSRARGLPAAAKNLVRTLYGHDGWRRARVSPDTAVAAGYWIHRATAKANLQALEGMGLLVHIGGGRHVAVQDAGLREALLIGMDPVPADGP